MNTGLEYQDFKDFSTRKRFNEKELEVAYAIEQLLKPEEILHFYPKNLSRSGNGFEAYCFTENKLLIFKAEELSTRVVVVKYENIFNIELLYNSGYNPLELQFKVKDNISYRLHEKEDSIQTYQRDYHTKIKMIFEFLLTK